MPVAETQTIYVKAEDRPTHEGIFHFTQFSSSDRLRRALGVLGVFWGLAAVTILIPLAHFVLVPGFFIAGPIMAFMRYKVDTASENVIVLCPSCEHEVTIKLEMTDRLPLYAYCPDCNSSLHLTDT